MNNYIDTSSTRHSATYGDELKLNLRVDGETVKNNAWVASSELINHLKGFFKTV